MAQENHQPARPGPRRVALVVDGGSNPFEIGCACEVFGAPFRPEIGRELYRLCVVTPDREATLRDGLFTVRTAGDLSELRKADLVIVPNRPDVSTRTRPALLDALLDAHARGADLVGLCTGAYTLAETGILDGRPAAVHWQLADHFRRRFPRVLLQSDLLFVDDGDILTSAGSAAALDLGLHIVRRDHGAAVANQVSRRLVFAAFREGGQRQFVERPVPEPRGESLTPTLAWAQQRLDQTLSVEALARHAHTSATTLHRRFQAELGTTPLRWLTAERVELARRLIEETTSGSELVAHRTGLGTTANLRALMKRHTGLSPSAYRERFGAGRARGSVERS